MALDNIWNLCLSVYYVYETSHISETYCACWISSWSLSSPSWRSSSLQSRHRWPRGFPLAGLCCRWCRGSSWCIAPLSFYSSPLQTTTTAEMWVKSCSCKTLWFILKYLRKWPKAPVSLSWSAYLRAVEVCRQHNDGVGEDICRVSTGKEGLSRKRTAEGGMERENAD